MAIQPKQAQRPLNASSEADATRAPAAPMSLRLPAGVRLRPIRRLVVLVPDSVTDEAGLSRCVWLLAEPKELEVLYLGLGPAAVAEPYARRRLATLTALTQDDRVRVKTRLSPETDWGLALQAHLRPGDLIVCHTEQNLALGWGRRQPLERALSEALQAPVQALTGYCAETERPYSSLFARLAFWGGSAAIVGVFFWLQGRIGQMSQDAFQTGLLLLTVLIEFGLIAAWNRLF